MALVAVVDNTNTVVYRVVVPDGVPLPPFDGMTSILETTQTGPSSRGYTWDGVQFHPPPPNPTPALTPQQLRVQAYLAETNRQDLVNRLQNATPAQIDAWLTTNVTSLPQALTVLSAIIKVLATQQLS
jgi:hypothetical protein